MRRLFAIALTALLAFDISVNASEKAAPIIRTELQIVSIQTKDALILVPQLRDRQTFDRGFNVIQLMLAEERAELVDSITTYTQSETRSTSENVVETRYATDFDPSSIPQSFSAAPARRLKNADRLNLLRYSNLHVPEIPTAFETRNVGTTLEIDAKVLGQTQLIETAIAAQYVRLQKFIEYKTPIHRNGTYELSVQPVFSTRLSTANLVLRSGQWMLFGTFVEEDPSKTILTLLKTTIKP